MQSTELDIGEGLLAPRTKTRKAALEALESLLRAQVALSDHRDPEGPYGILRAATDHEIDLIEAVFQHCSVPLPATLRAIYRRTLGVGNPVSPLPVMAVPFLRAGLPDEGFGCPVLGLLAFEEGLNRYPDESNSDRPPVLHLGHAAPLGLTVSRNGLWSLQDYQGRRTSPQAQDFRFVFEAAFCAFVDQTILHWANDLAGDLVKQRDLDLTRGARLNAMPRAVQEARAYLVAHRTLGPKVWGEIEPLDNADILRGSHRGDAATLALSLGGAVTVVGLPYGDDPAAASRMGSGTLLRLRPVDDNPYDPNAVEVWQDGDHPVRVGFVARLEAPSLRALPQGASAWRLRLAARSDHALYARLEMGRPEEDAVSVGDPSSPLEALNRDLFS